MEVESHPTTLEEVRVPTIVKSLPFSMDEEVLISHIKKIKKQRNNGKMQELKNMYEEMEKNENNGAPKKLQDVFLPSSWIRKYVLYGGKVKTRMIGFFTFGEKFETLIHVEQFCSSTYGALICGKKHWCIWKPTQKPQYEEPAYKFTLEAGSTLYIPSGWFHYVLTSTRWSAFIGETITSAASLKAATQIQRTTPHALANGELQQIGKLLNIQLPSENKAAAASARKKVEILLNEGSTRRDRTGKVRRQKKFVARRRTKVNT
jgi:hypothetical protein